MKRILWLASYPKSGNTWLRAFIANLRSEGETPVNINEFDSVPIASARQLFDRVIGAESSDMTAEEIERLRPDVYENIAETCDEMVFMKIHDACTRLADGRLLISERATRGAIYIIRNPLDVAVSLSNHMNVDVNEAISRMNYTEYSLCSKTGRLNDQLCQRLSSWSEHVKSWVDCHAMPVHVVRYEEMATQPLETFTAVARFADLPLDPTRISQAIEFSDFAELCSQEQAEGFRERPPRSELFFRSGKPGAWRETLTERQAARIIKHHAEVMARFGYLSEDGKAVRT